ncbi:hypothetical protein [Kaistella sp.]|uniref:hypothetical protein n=1 Tax=Kaistella sp. TaxID=2782235 RepID=UPI003C3CB120
MKKKNLILFFYLLFLTSCVSAVLKLTGITEANAKVNQFNFEQKKCAFLGMHHIGKEEFYNDVKKKIDSLRKENFVVFYEGFKVSKSSDKQDLKNNTMKFRKITNIPISLYIDSTNHAIGLDMKKWKLVNQPEDKDLGIDSTKDINAELPFGVLINKFEERYGEIILDKCDFETPLLSKEYKCTSIKNGLQKFQKLRNQELAQQIMESKNKKIAIVFGKDHYKDLRKILDSVSKNR